MNTSPLSTRRRVIAALALALSVAALVVVALTGEPVALLIVFVAFVVIGAVLL